MQTSLLLFNIVLEILATAIREEEKIKVIQIRYKDVKFSLFTDNIILYREKILKTTKKLLKLINEFSEVTGYKINIQKLFAFLYSKISEKEIKKAIPFTIAT